MRRFGFTLAEVLITLGIIGVVAAMTMPVISANVQKNVLKNKFKKTYSNIQNTINLISTQNGSEYACYFHSPRAESDNAYELDDCPSFWNDFFNKLSVIEIVTADAIPDYKSTDEILSEGGELGSWGVGCSFIDKTHPENIKTYVLNDGSMFMKSRDYQLIVDVNGNKGPNKFGYDVFGLYLVKVDKRPPQLLDTVCTIKEKGGFYPSEILINK